MEWRGIVSGSRRDVASRMIRALCVPAAWIYRAIVGTRNALYDRGWLTIHRVDLPVVSIGNLTAGGTGKTPLVIWLARYLSEHGESPAIISRGYGAADGALNDEGEEIRSRLPQVPQSQSPDRRLAIERVRMQQEQGRVDPISMIVLDDGFQHRRIHRDLDIVVIDATCPWGYGALLPRGLLREPRAGLRRAQVVVLSRSDRIAPMERDALRGEVSRIAPDVRWVETIHSPTLWIDRDGHATKLAELEGKRVFACTAIGNPASFEHSVRALGCEWLGMQTFADHHRYTQDDLDAIESLAREHGAEYLICTHKDLVKLGKLRATSLPLRALVLQLEITVGERELLETLRPLMKAATGVESAKPSAG